MTPTAYSQVSNSACKSGKTLDMLPYMTLLLTLLFRKREKEQISFDNLKQHHPFCRGFGCLFSSQTHVIYDGFGSRRAQFGDWMFVCVCTRACVCVSVCVCVCFLQCLLLLALITCVPIVFRKYKIQDSKQNAKSNPEGMQQSAFYQRKREKWLNSCYVVTCRESTGKCG